MKIDDCLAKLGPKYYNYKETYSDVSVDDSDKNNPVPIVDENLPIINFDKVKEQHGADRGYTDDYESNDALFVDDDNNLYFIEFKRGKAKREDLRTKSSESLLIAMDLGIISSLEDSRQRVEYLFVTPNHSLEKLHQYSANKLPKLILSQRWLFKDIHAYTPREFRQIFLVKHYQGFNP